MGSATSSRNQEPDHSPGHARHTGHGVKMAVETNRSWESKAERIVRPWWSQIFRWFGRQAQSLARYGFSSLSRRILFLNLLALFGLMTGILFLNQFREGLIDAREESLLTQGEIIAAAIAASATVETNTITIDPDRLLELETGQSLSPVDEFDALEFPINPAKIAPVLRHLILPTGTRARIYDDAGSLILDSRNLYSRGEILRYDLPEISTDNVSWYDRVWRSFMVWLRRGDLPLYEELGPDNGLGYPEVTAALTGSKGVMVRVNDHGELLVSVAVPVRRFRTVLGVLLLSTRGGDIDAVLSAERFGILRVFLVAAGISIILSMLLARTIAGPMHRLAAGADRVRRSIKAREEIPDFTHRQDEIGDLSGALREMTNALYRRIEAIESFAADVSHELKNPLTSLQSAVETMPLAKTDHDKARLTKIILHDIKRLDRLISDISDASRLDAELALADAEPVDIRRLLQAVVDVANSRQEESGVVVDLDIKDTSARNGFQVNGHASRLGQVIDNLLSNALTFSARGDHIRVSAERQSGMIEIRVEDNGPGINPENLERIFSRFHTDRPAEDAFGDHSGLGLSISEQIIASHKGTIRAENRDIWKPDGKRSQDEISGARFIVRLPVLDRK